MIKFNHIYITIKIITITMEHRGIINEEIVCVVNTEGHCTYMTPPLAWGNMEEVDRIENVLTLIYCNLISCLVLAHGLRNRP